MTSEYPSSLCTVKNFEPTKIIVLNKEGLKVHHTATLSAEYLSKICFSESGNKRSQLYVDPIFFEGFYVLLFHNKLAYSQGLKNYFSFKQNDKEYPGPVVFCGSEPLALKGLTDEQISTLKNEILVSPGFLSRRRPAVIYSLEACPVPRRLN